ncbi:MAG: porin family protein [Flavobacterium sp.]
MKNILISLTALFSVQIISAQEVQSTKRFETFFTKNMSYQINANFSIGGASPLGLPEEIRSIDSYNPTLLLGLEANATKWLTDDHKWGVRMGLRFEEKGMKTDARVKNYLIEVKSNTGPSRGYFTGDVYTNVKNTYLTIPISAVYSINQNWNVYGGLYFSALIDKNFTGNVSNGYLREKDPTGLKVEFNDGAEADYDYSDEVRKFQWGTQVGAEWKMNKHFKLFGDVTYGFNGVLNSDFDAISFSMHNIYLNLGFGYQF